MFFGGLGGHARQRRGPQPGPDAEIAVDITLDDAAFGATREVTRDPAPALRDLRGLGLRAGDLAGRPATSAQGSGEVRRVRNSILGQMVTVDAVLALRRHGLAHRDALRAAAAATGASTRPRR